MQNQEWKKLIQEALTQVQVQLKELKETEFRLQVCLGADSMPKFKVVEPLMPTGGFVEPHFPATPMAHKPARKHRTKPPIRSLILKTVSRGSKTVGEIRESVLAIRPNASYAGIGVICCQMAKRGELKRTKTNKKFYAPKKGN